MTKEDMGNIANNTIDEIKQAIEEFDFQMNLRKQQVLNYLI